MKTKRLLIATLLGVASGFVCCAMAKSGGNELPTLLSVNIISSRALIGIAIGLSRFPMKHWALHGLIIGLVFSIPAAFGAMLGPENPEFNYQAMFIATVFMGGVYGLLIEFITNVLFKAKQ